MQHPEKNHSLSKKKTITIINKEAYFDLMDRNDLDIIISPVQITVSHILKYIRKGLVFNAHKVKKGAAEVIEMNVDDSIKKIIGKRIVDLGLNGSMNIPAICREDKVLMAHGVTEIKEGDHLLIFYKDKSVFDSFYNKYKCGKRKRLIDLKTMERVLAAFGFGSSLTTTLSGT